MEFKRAVKWGMTAHQALVADTPRGAEVLGIDAETGSIEEGKAADLIAIAGNPLADITVLSKPLFVIKSGISVIERS